MANLNDGPKKPKRKGSKPNPVAKKEVTVYAPNQEDVHKRSNGRGRFTSTDKKGKRNWIYNIGNSNDKLYAAGKYGLNGRTRYSTSNIDDKTSFVKSMDTTGFAKGKKTFTINSIKKSGGKDGELKKMTTKSAKIPRSEVLSTLDKWKAAASKMTSGKKSVKAQKPNVIKSTKTTGKSRG
jgi:hypothetical protein